MRTWIIVDPGLVLSNKVCVKLIDFKVINCLSLGKPGGVTYLKPSTIGCEDFIAGQQFASKYPALCFDPEWMLSSGANFFYLTIFVFQFQFKDWRIRCYKNPHYFA